MVDYFNMFDEEDEEETPNYFGSIGEDEGQEQYSSPQNFSLAPEASVFSAPVSEVDSFIGSQPSSRQALVQAAQDKMSEANAGRFESIDDARDLIKSGGNIWGSLLTSVIPAIAGAAMGGSEMAALGAEAGFKGALAGNEVGMKTDQQLANLSLREADIHAEQENSSREEIQDLQRRDLAFKDNMALQDRFDTRAEDSQAFRREMQEDSQAFRAGQGALNRAGSGGPVSGGGIDWFSKVPAADRAKIASAEGTINSLSGLAEGLKGLKIGRAEFQASKWIASTKTYDLLSTLRLQLGKIARLGGDVGNIAEQEQKRIESALAGNATSSPYDMARRVDNLVQRVRDNVVSTLQSHKTGITQGGDALMSRLEGLGSPSDIPTDQSEVPPGVQKEEEGVESLTEAEQAELAQLRQRFGRR